MAAEDGWNGCFDPQKGLVQTTPCHFGVARNSSFLSFERDRSRYRLMSYRQGSWAISRNGTLDAEAHDWMGWWKRW
jgi:hypothetical protein